MSRDRNEAVAVQGDSGFALKDSTTTKSFFNQLAVALSSRIDGLWNPETGSLAELDRLPEELIDIEQQRLRDYKAQIRAIQAQREWAKKEVERARQH